MKWFVLCHPSRSAFRTSRLSRLHFRSKNGESRAELKNHPRESKASFTQGYHPVIEKTRVSTETWFFFFQSAKSLAARGAEMSPFLLWERREPREDTSRAVRTFRTFPEEALIIAPGFLWNVEARMRMRMRMSVKE